MFKVSVKISIFFLFLLCVAEISHAAPTVSGISGAVINGGTMNISGSSFGTKPTAAPIKWDDFENGVEGGDLSTYGSWDLTYGIHNKYSSSSNRAGSTLCMEHALTTEVDPDFDATKCNARYAMRDTFPKVYMSYWMYFQWGQIMGQQKFGARIGNWISGPSWTDPRFDGCVYPTAAGCSAHEPYYQVVDGAGLNVSTCFGQENAFVDGDWVQVEIEAMQSSNNMEDGVLRTWISKQTGPMKLVFNDSTYKLRSSDNAWNMVGIYHWIAGTERGLSTTIRYDDIYIDNVWSRVVICDSETYSNCTHRALQAPSIWTDDSITVTVNQDSWALGNTAYLYVIDENGDVSEGYPVTFGGGSGDTTPPASPSGLIVS